MRKWLGGAAALAAVMAGLFGPWGGADADPLPYTLNPGYVGYQAGSSVTVNVLVGPFELRIPAGIDVVAGPSCVRVLGSGGTSQPPTVLDCTGPDSAVLTWPYSNGSALLQLTTPTVYYISIPAESSLTTTTSASTTTVATTTTVSTTTTRLCLRWAFKPYRHCLNYAPTTTV